ncbi:junctional sarcoplasmic reticulum protein 1 isoform X2 [Notamacropus eugenii]|uniref:junctional sarcoplasmic reticulum protein 1 isoform X2 n=1 Tax=Notamacropus eugenii TaxID=9315 RepID=UPI003B684A4A
MATGNLEMLDRGLGCPETIEELTMSMERSRNESQEEDAKGGEKAESREELSSQEQELAEEEQAEIQIGKSVLRSSRLMEHSADQVGSGKDRGKTAAAPKSAPARKKTKAQSQPQVKAQPRTLGPVSDELPWGEITLNKCLALASVVAVLSMAFQVFQDVIDGEEDGTEATPGLWAWPGSGTPRDSGPKLPKPRDWAKVSAPATAPGPTPSVKERRETTVISEAPSKERAAEGQEAQEKLSSAPAPEASVLPQDPPPSSKAARPEKPSWAALPKKEEKARNKKGFREERERKEGGHGLRPRREQAEEAPRRPWEREHRHPGKREDSRKSREPRGKREEHGSRGGHEDRHRFFPKQKHREGKRRD